MKNNYSPDILNCLANLSSDEVFTSPELANRMLDLLPPELFRSSKTRFLDPCSKSGVFLREIAKRLLAGLEEEIPDLQKRIDHIMAKQVFGVACTDLTAEMSRRTLYCTKQANGEYSVTTAFHDEQGNLRYDRCNHTWNAQGRCEYCGASKGEYLRTDSRETYAYPFIHKSINEIFHKDMQFDVIIGNPPYQMSDGGDAAGDAAMPIYNKFINQSKKVNPRYLIMIVPSKWMVGGRGLQTFRREMITDDRIRVMVDHENSFDCFPGVHIDGGVCYFLWDREYHGTTSYTFKPTNGNAITTQRKLLSEGSEIVIRDYRRETIIKKVNDKRMFTEIVSARKPFGIGTDLFNCPENYVEYELSEKPFKDSVRIYGVKGKKGGAKRVEGFVNRLSITKGVELIDKYKLYISKAYSTDAITPPELIKGEPNDLATETFLVIGPFTNKKERDNCLSYTSTIFFRVLLFWGRGTMQVSRDVFRFVPLQDFSHPWTYEMLYKKYNLDKDEIAFIESMIRPME